MRSIIVLGSIAVTAATPFIGETAAGAGIIVVMFLGVVYIPLVVAIRHRGKKATPRGLERRTITRSRWRWICSISALGGLSYAAYRLIVMNASFMRFAIDVVVVVALAAAFYVIGLWTHVE